MVAMFPDKAMSIISWPAIVSSDVGISLKGLFVEVVTQVNHRVIVDPERIKLLTPSQ